MYADYSYSMFFYDFVFKKKKKNWKTYVKSAALCRTDRRIIAWFDDLQNG